MEKTSIETPFNCDAVLEYKAGFDLAPLKPTIGDVFRVFIPERFFLITRSSVVEREIYGTTFYTPTSDIVNIAIHCGCLFAHPRSSGISRRWCTILNLYEAICNDDNYVKMCDVMEIPKYAQVQGLIVDILIDNTMRNYPGTSRNGMKSRTFHGPTEYSLRIVNHKILTKFERKPPIADIDHYIRQHIKMPVFKFAFNREIGIEYSPELFRSIFSPQNVQNYFFAIYKLFFDVGETRYEISYDEDTTLFNVFRLINPIELKEYKSRKSRKPNQESVAEDVNLFDIVPQQHGLSIKGVDFSPVSTIFVALFYAKMNFTKKQ